MLNDRRLNKIEINRFKGLETFDLDNIGGFNVILGANGVGKTSLLEAIFLFNGFAAGTTPVALHNSRNYLVRGFEDLTYYFHNLDLDADISMTGTMISSEKRKLSISSHVPESEIIVPTQNIGYHSETPGVVRQTLETSARRRVWRYSATIIVNDSEKPFEGTLDIVSPDKLNVKFSINQNELDNLTISTQILTPGRGYNTQAISKLIINNNEDKLLEALRFIDPRLNKITTDGDLAYLDIGLEQMMPLNMFGNGMIRATEILTAGMLGYAQILLIDEIENGLHFTAVRQLLQVLLAQVNNQQIQIFCTTHSVDVLQGLRDVLQEEQFADMRGAIRSYVLAKDKDGLIRPYRYDYEKFDHCIEHGIEIR